MDLEINFTEPNKLYNPPIIPNDYPFPSFELFPYKGMKGIKLTHKTSELWSRCPLPPNHYPDQCDLTIEYFPNEVSIELKSLKMFLFSFRDRAISHEDVTNIILKTIADAVQVPVTIIAEWAVRGGVYTTIGGIYCPLKGKVFDADEWSLEDIEASRKVDQIMKNVKKNSLPDLEKNKEEYEKGVEQTIKKLEKMTDQEKIDNTID